MKKLILPVLIIILAAFLTQGAWAQSKTTISEIDTSAFPTISFKVQFPNKNEVKRYVSEQNTQVLENGVPMNFTISCPLVPIYFALILDKSLSMAFYPNSEVIDSDSARWRGAKSAIKTFADNLTSPDNACLISYSAVVSVNVPFTDNGDLIKRRVESIRLGSGTATFDACYRGIDSLKRKAGGRVIILLTDGDDNSSVWGRSEATTIAYARQNGVSIYTVGLGEFRDSIRLKEMALQTGGKFYLSADGSDLVTIYDDIIQSVTYEPCIVTYTTDGFCPDSTKRTIELSTSVNSNFFIADTFYRAPFDLEKTSIISTYPDVIAAGEEFRVQMQFKTELRRDEPTDFTSTIYFNPDLIEFVGISSDSGIFIDNDPIAVAAHGRLTISAQTTVYTASNNYLFTLVFRAKTPKVAQTVTFQWLDVNVVRKCNTITTGEIFTFIVDGLCDKLVRQKEPPLLQSAYPNPAKSITNITFGISEEHSDGRTVSLRITNAGGEEVVRLADGFYSPGVYTIPWDTKTAAEGIYWVELQSEKGRESKKIIVIK